MLPTSNTTPEMLEALVNNLRGKTICGIKIHDAKAELSEGSDFEPCIAVRVLLDDPKPEIKAWPVEAFLGISREIRRVAHELNISEWPYVTSHVALSEAHLVKWAIPDGIELLQ